jgi:hypothetical protein
MENGRLKVGIYETFRKEPFNLGVEILNLKNTHDVIYLEEKDENQLIKKY